MMRFPVSYDVWFPVFLTRITPAQVFSGEANL